MTRHHLLGFLSSAYCGKTTFHSFRIFSCTHGIGKKWPMTQVKCNTLLHSCLSVILHKILVRHSLVLHAQDCLTKILLALQYSQLMWSYLTSFYCRMSVSSHRFCRDGVKQFTFSYSRCSVLETDGCLSFIHSGSTKQ